MKRDIMYAIPKLNSAESWSEKSLTGEEEDYLQTEEDKFREQVFGMGVGALLRLLNAVRSTPKATVKLLQDTDFDGISEYYEKVRL